MVWKPDARLDGGVTLMMEAVRSAGPQSLIGVDGNSLVVRMLEAYGQLAVHASPIDIGVRVGLIPERWIEQVEKGYDSRGLVPLPSDDGTFFDRSDLALVTDGCFEAPAVAGDAAVFMPVESLGEQDLLRTLQRLHADLTEHLEDASDGEPIDEALVACVQLGLPLRAVGPSPCAAPPASPMLVRGFGMQLHAAVTVDGRDRKRLERVCRYLLRPPFALDAVSAHRRRAGSGALQEANPLRGHLRPDDPRRLSRSAVCTRPCAPGAYRSVLRRALGPPRPALRRRAAH